MDLKNKRIALIGGSGFIGHNLALALQESGAKPQIVDSLQVNNLLAFASTDTNIVNRELYVRILNDRLSMLNEAGIPLYVQDARDYHALTKVLEAIKPQVIIMLAAVSHANKSNKDPYSTFDHSFRTLENALDYSRSDSSAVEHFIYFSSSMVYGNFTNGFVTEETPCNPIGIYGALKFAGEKLVIAYNQVFDLAYTIVRPSALYGERCVSRRVGQIFIENAIQGKDITVNGDGSDRLDFTYIEDLVDGVIKIIQNENSRNQIFNLTYGESRSIANIAEIVAQKFSNIHVNYKPKDKLTPDRGTLSVEKARSMIGYNPQNPLQTGFPKYIDWYCSLYQ